MMFAAGVCTGLALAVLLLMGFIGIATTKLRAASHRDTDADSISVAKHTKDRARRRRRSAPDIA